MHFINSLEDLNQFVSESSLEQFKTNVPHFSYPQIAEIFVLLQTRPAIESKQKFDCLLPIFDSPATLEILGKHFAVHHFLSFLEFLVQHPSEQKKLSFILIGLKPSIFSQSLHFLQHKHLTFLQHEGMLEPLQYHLLQFIHEGESLYDQTEQKILQFIHDLQLKSNEEWNPDELRAFYDQIESIRNQLLDYLERMSTALSIVWHTDRIDLIEKLSSLNETLQHQLIAAIGHRPFEDIPATGLYRTLELTLSKIFDSALKDEDSALDGLTRLSIWHLDDYWELGLLPSIQEACELDLDPRRHTEDARLAHRHSLLSQIQQRLERLKIGTVGELKKKCIFSKPLLRAYIHKHHSLLED